MHQAPVARFAALRTVQAMTTTTARPGFIARHRTTGEQLIWRDALRDVWQGATSPDALEVAVIWPDSLCEVAN